MLGLLQTQKRLTKEEKPVNNNFDVFSVLNIGNHKPESPFNLSQIRCLFCVNHKLVLP